MKLIGMLDSPYVRRVAISLDLLGIAFEHEAVSVFSTFERFQAINPVVKAPTLITGDGTVLMDSSLILQYVESTHISQPPPVVIRCHHASGRVPGCGPGPGGLREKRADGL